MPVIRFEAQVFTIGTWTLVQLPKVASAELPSRGLVMVQGTANGFEFQSALEPDGNGSHWFEVNKSLRAGAGVEAGDSAQFAIEATKDWPEPTIPTDIAQGLARVPDASSQWSNITPMARWEWIRWIRATNRLETRNRRIEVACSKLKNGERRPCCFNSSMCTEPEVSKNGVLLLPANVAV